MLIKIKFYNEKNINILQPNYLIGSKNTDVKSFNFINKVLFNKVIVHKNNLFIEYFTYLLKLVKLYYARNIIIFE